MPRNQLNTSIILFLTTYRKDHTVSTKFGLKLGKKSYITRIRVLVHHKIKHKDVSKPIVDKLFYFTSTPRGLFYIVTQKGETARCFKTNIVLK